MTDNGFSLTELPASSPVRTTNFIHLYWDVAWFGLTFGSTLSFLAVFATRLGAPGWQVGLLSAGPALINILVTVPAGRWLQARPLSAAVTRAAVWHRAGYFVLLLVPWFLSSRWQVWVLLALIFLMAVPGAALAVGFNGLLAAAVPLEARGRIIGRRNALLSGTILVSFLISGWILEQLPFAWGYTVVFALGALGAGMSTYHMSRVQVESVGPFLARPLTDHAQPGRLGGFSGVVPFKMSLSLRLWLNGPRRTIRAAKRISGSYWRMMAAFFSFHFAQFLPAALFPIFWVREAGLSDGTIGWINALFYLTMLIISPFLEPLSRRFGTYPLTISGALLLSLYPLLTALSDGVILLVVANLLGGAVWAILAGALTSRLLESVPEDSRPSHLALYNLALNAAVLSGTMLGPWLADLAGLREALFIAFVFRVVSGLVLARWG